MLQYNFLFRNKMVKAKILVIHSLNSHQEAVGHIEHVGGVADGIVHFRWCELPKEHLCCLSRLSYLGSPLGFEHGLPLLRLSQRSRHPIRHHPYQTQRMLLRPTREGIGFALPHEPLSYCPQLQIRVPSLPIPARMVFPGPDSTQPFRMVFPGPDSTQPFDHQHVILAIAGCENDSFVDQEFMKCLA